MREPASVLFVCIAIILSIMLCAATYKDIQESKFNHELELAKLNCIKQG